MKAVWVAVVVLCTVLVLVGINCAYVNRVVEQMETLADALPEAPSPEAVKQIEALSQLLESHKRSLSVSISFPLLDRVKELIDSACVYAEAPDASNYASTRAMLLDAIRDLKRLEKIDVENIM